jgi:hypothetical protein
MPARPECSARTLDAAQPVGSTIREDWAADMYSIATPPMLMRGQRHFKNEENDPDRPMFRPK